MLTNIPLLKYYMNQKGATQKTLSKVAGVSQTSMSTYFTGKVPFDAQVIIKICDFLDLPPVARGLIFLSPNYHGMNDLDLMERTTS